MTDFQFNYNEDKIINDLVDYVKSTYGQHYANDANDIQLFDYWQSLGIMSTMGRGTAMKYLARYGKKSGKNRKDLMKALHYTILALWAEDLAAEQEELVESDVQPDFGREVATEVTAPDYMVFDQQESGPRNLSDFLELLRRASHS